jgi:hypothetical protein
MSLPDGEYSRNAFAWLRGISTMSESSVQQVFDHRWPSGMDEWLAVPHGDAEELANRLQITAEHWEEDGLGPAVGFFCRLGSGRVVLVYTLHFQPNTLNVSLDSQDLALANPENVLSEILRAFELALDDVEWSR